MKMLIDADACPVTDIAVRLCGKYHVPCLLLCDTAHAIYREGAETLVFDKGADSVDFALVNRVEAGMWSLPRITGWPPCAWPAGQWCFIRMAGRTQRTIFKRYCFSAMRRSGIELLADT